jgi:DNA-binding NtrC family response regulator
VSDAPSTADAKPDTVRILLVEDDDGSAVILQKMLARWRFGAFSVLRAANLAAALALAGRERIDLVLLDLGLPDSQGPDTFGRMLAGAAPAPIIVLTGADDEDLGTAMVRQGAQDYIAKGQVDSASLARAVRHAVERCRAQRELAEEHDRATAEFASAASRGLKAPLASMTRDLADLLGGAAGPVPEHLMGRLRALEADCRRMEDAVEDTLASIPRLRGQHGRGEPRQS